MDTAGLPELIEAMTIYSDNEQMTHYGNEMFRMYTEGGFPPDMFLDELGSRIDLSLLAKVYILFVYQKAFLDHRRKSGIDEKRVENIRRRNREDIIRLIEKGEIGVY